MLDIPSISAVVAAVGVIVGVVFTVLELRNLVKIRQTDLLIGLYSTMRSREILGAWEKVRDEEIRDYSDAMKKAGGVGLNQIILVFEEVGILLHRKLIDVSLAEDLFPVKYAWEKLKPMIEGARERFNRPGIGEWFEYLYNEMQKREQRLQQTQQ